MRKIIFSLIITVILAVIVSIYTFNYSPGEKMEPTPETLVTPPGQTILNPAPRSQQPSAQVETNLTPPINNAKERVTKKPFGIFVSPKVSPVSPEKFSGFHTGTDFETTPEEQNTDVAIMAICSGVLTVKKTATGYGGVVVQSCMLNGLPVTIVYGHLKITSVSKTVGSNITQGEQLGVLGTGYSNETSGERKHLHLGIHKGTQAVLLGYVKKQNDLSAWIDVMKYMQ